MSEKEPTPAADLDVIVIAAGCSRRLASMTQDIPKPFLPVGNSTVIEKNLDTLDAFGLRHVTCVVGYKKEVFYERLGKSYKNLEIDYVEALDYEKTGHGWSLFGARKTWEKRRNPVLLVHGDIVYHRDMLTKLFVNRMPNAMTIDDHFKIKTKDEVLVYGTKDRITSIVHPSFQKVKESNKDLLGECIGLTRWSAEYMEELFGFMETFFAKNGHNFNWEPVVDALMPVSKHTQTPILTGGLPWVNINYEEDLREAEAIVRSFEH